MTDAALLLHDPSARLESAFRSIYAERMQGLPFVNRSVRVEAIAFAPWKHYWLGVMLTPWSMNLMLTPRDRAAWRSLPHGAKRRYRFPAGCFDFISASDDEIGDFLACSLFSPVLEFDDHETARQTARLARDALFDAANADLTELPAAEMDPTRAASDAAARYVPGTLAQLEATLNAPISRRDLLHGRISADDDDFRG